MVSESTPDNPYPATRDPARHAGLDVERRALDAGVTSSRTGLNMDRWPVAEAGLPPRAVRCLTAAGYTTIGSVRAAPERVLAGLPGFGSGSLAAVKGFLAACAGLEAEPEAVFPARSLLTRFLTDRQYEVLAARYGLTADQPLRAPGQATLQAIGTRLHQTRERVRQIEAEALGTLGTRLARALFGPVFATFEDLVTAGGGMVDAETVWKLKDDPAFEGVNPTGLLICLCDAGYALFYEYGCFTAVPPELTAAVAGAIRQYLGTQPAPVGALQVEQAVRDAIGAACPPPAVVTGILDRLPEVAVARDGAYGLRDQGIGALIERIMRSRPRPLHYRAITRELNTAMRPGSRYGTGTVLKALGGDRRFRRVASGHYTLSDS